VARVVAFVPDLLFGSNVLGALSAAGHEATLAGDEQRLAEQAPEADVLIVDLTADAAQRIAAAQAASDSRPDGTHTPTLAFYAHVEADVRTLAQDAGFDLVIPRSRMAREGAALVTRLASGP
jgi:CheY-like chemotaxis protein